MSRRRVPARVSLCGSLLLALFSFSVQGEAQPSPKTKKANCKTDKKYGCGGDSCECGDFACPPKGKKPCEGWPACQCLDNGGTKTACTRIQVSYECACPLATGGMLCRCTNCPGSGAGTPACGCAKRECGVCTRSGALQCMNDSGKGCNKAYFPGIGVWVTCTHMRPHTRGRRCCPKFKLPCTGSCSSPTGECGCTKSKCRTADCPGSFSDATGTYDCPAWTVHKNNTDYQCRGVRWRHCCHGCKKDGTGYIAFGCSQTQGEMCDRHCGNTVSACNVADMCDCTGVWGRNCSALNPCKKCTAFSTTKRCPGTVVCNNW